MGCALVGLLAVACRASPNAGAGASPRASVPQPAIESLVLGGPDAPVASTRSPSGDLLVSTPHALLRFAKGQTAEAIVTPFPEQVVATATAREAEVTAILADSGAVYLAEGAPRATVRRTFGVRRGSKIAISDDGHFVAVDEYVDPSSGASLAPASRTGAMQKVGIYDTRGLRVALGEPDRVEFDSRSRFVAVTGAVVRLDGSSPIPVAGGRALGWSGSTAVFADARGLVLVATDTGEKSSVALCGGQRWVDLGHGRIVELCGRNLVVVDVATRKRSTTPLPLPVDVVVADVRPARDGDHVFASFTRYGDPPKHWSFDIDPTTNEALPLDPFAEPPTRAWAGVDRRAEPGPSPLLALKDEGARVRVDGEGLDIERPGKDGAVLRVGPSAPTSRREVPAGSEPRTSAGCPSASLHDAVTSGELWYESTAGVRPKACICRDHACQETPRGPFLAALGGAGNALVLGSWGSPNTQIHVTDLAGDDRGVIMVDGFCRAAVARADAKVAAVRCALEPSGAETLLELDLVAGDKTRSTPLPFARTWSQVIALTPSSVFVETDGGPSQTDYVVEIEAGTGRRSATIYPFPNGAIVRFEDGRVELDGDAEPAERAIFCVDSGVARPFATCRDRLSVEGRYRVAR